MADYGPGYDPSQADYISAEDQAIGGLIELTALAMVGVVVFVAVETGAIVVLTQGQQAILALLESGELDSLGAQSFLEAFSANWMLGIDAVAITSLYNYNTSSNPLLGHYNNLRSYVDFYGESLAPLNTGGPGSGHNFPTPPPHGGWVCYTEDDTHVTTCWFTPY